LKTKNSNNSAFYENKWFKLICCFVFFGWLFYLAFIPSLKVSPNELTAIKVTVNEKWESGGSRDPIKLYFKTKEYSNRFGIYVGGTFGRWTEVTNALEQNSSITIKINKKDKKNLNLATEVIPIYYLKSDNLGLMFSENDFNHGEKSSDTRFVWFLIVLFIISLWNILRD